MILAVSDYYDHSVDDDPEKGPGPPMPWELERAILCESYNWQILPHEIDEADVAALKQPVYLLRTFRALQRAGKDLDSITETDAAILSLVLELQEQRKKFQAR